MLYEVITGTLLACHEPQPPSDLARIAERNAAAEKEAQQHWQPLAECLVGEPLAAVCSRSCTRNSASSASCCATSYNFV